MSASLVGSEMCIRDSLESAPGIELVVFKPEEAQNNCCWPHGLSQRPRPVSYTHLTLPTICSV
eukprot:1469348-Alexandrium_andersonii.AAC.1